MSDNSQNIANKSYQNLKRKYMKMKKKKVPKKERFIRLLIKRWLPTYHLSRNPTKKIKEETHHPTGETPVMGEAGS